MATCEFCRIVAKQQPTALLYESADVIAFPDINPSAPIHILIVPNKHLESTRDLTPEDAPLAGHMLIVAHRLAEQAGIQDSGYRLIVNTGPDANQRVFHLHLHLIGGQRMRHPMG